MLLLPYYWAIDKTSRKGRVNMQTITKKDFETIKGYKQQFIKPLQILMKLSQSDIAFSGLASDKKFEEVILQLKDIEQQGLKHQFSLFVDLVFAN